VNGPEYAVGGDIAQKQRLPGESGRPDAVGYRFRAAAVIPDHDGHVPPTRRCVVLFGPPMGRRAMIIRVLGPPSIMTSSGKPPGDRAE
jgi:hypothetical protein